MKCFMCPRKCGADRFVNNGKCGANDTVRIALYKLFEFEEPCISGTKGSGAIFFSGCSLGCVFCQNYDISTLNKGYEISIKNLSEIFKELEQMGAHNINLVNPTHYVLQIVEALKIYRPNIPIIYNTHGYEDVETLEFISPYIDIFLPDFKYINSISAEKYSFAKDYVEITKSAIKKMRELKSDVFEDGIMKQGLIIRHLILPLHSNDSTLILQWIKENVPQTLVSLMAQYVPYGKVSDSCYSEINRKITKREYDKVVDKYLSLNLDGYVQDRESSSTKYIPIWDVK